MTTRAEVTNGFEYSGGSRGSSASFGASVHRPARPPVDLPRATASSDDRGPGETPHASASRPARPPLSTLCSSWEDITRTRMAFEQRGLPELAQALKPLDEHLVRQISISLRRHSLWPWLSQFPGLGGTQTARLISIIRDPRRFPGQRCSIGHYAPAIYEVGAACPAVMLDKSACEGLMMPPRPHTGVSSLWKFCGLHVVDGKSPRKTRGQRTTWNVKARTAVLMPYGIADQIVRLRVPRYRDIYDAKKASLTRERGIETDGENARVGDPALTDGAEPDYRDEIDSGRGLRPIQNSEIETSHGNVRADDLADGAQGANGSMRSNGTLPLRPIQIEGIARKVAAKAFVGDLLTEWKRLMECK